MSRYLRRRSLQFAGCVLFVGVFLVGVTRKVDAQGAPGAFVELMAAIAQLQTTVEQLLPGAPNTVLVTPVIRASGADVWGCRMVNVSDGPVTVRMETFYEFSALQLPPGHLILTTELAAGEITDDRNTGAAVLGYCKFTVVNGAADDIRANVAVTVSPGGDKFSLPAE